MGVKLELAYLIVTGTTTAPLATEIVNSLLGLVRGVITIATPNAAQVIAPRDLSVIQGNRLVESYFDTAILPRPPDGRSEEHTSELQSRPHLVCRLLLEKKKNRRKLDIANT